MSQLSRTILAGTSLIKDAAENLREAKAGKERRKRVAIKDLGGSLADMGETFKEHGSWKRAKADEDATMNFRNAVRLGYAQGGSEGALVAAKATPTPTPGSARVGLAEIARLEKLYGDEQVSDLDKAREAHLKQQTTDLETKAERNTALRASRKSVADAYPLKGASEGVQGMVAAFRAGDPGIEWDDIAAQHEKERQSSAAEALRQRVASEKERNNRARVELGYDKIESTDTRHASTLDYRREEAVIDRALKLQVHRDKMTMAEFAINARVQADEINSKLAQVRVSAALNKQSNAAARLELKLMEAANKLDLQAALVGTSPQALAAQGFIAMTRKQIQEAQRDLPKVDELPDYRPPVIGDDRSGGRPSNGHPSGAPDSDVQEITAAGGVWSGSAWDFPE